MTILGLVMLVIGLLAVVAAVLIVGQMHSHRGTAYAERDHHKQIAAQLESARVESAGKVDALQQQLTQARADYAALQERAQQETKAAAEKLELARGQREQLSSEFEQLANQALRHNNDAFLKQAGEKFTALQQHATQELKHRHDQAERSIKPLDDKLASFSEQVQQLEKERASAFTAIHEQIKAVTQHAGQLQSETRRLSQALRAPQQRGQWGELQLRRIVEFAGMLNRVDFTEQHSITTDEGTVRPDMVIHLGGDKQLVVDAKVSLSALLEAFESDDADYRAERFAAHARHLRQHVDELADKAYWQRLAVTPEFVVAFVPSEPAVSIALENDPSLYEYAFSRQVLLCTPASLVALLRTVNYIWRQEALAENAQQVLTVGRDLHTRLAKMSEHVTKLGKDLTRTVRSYNSTVGSLESRVLVTARKMNDLQVTDAALDQIDPVELAPRAPQAPELTGDDAEQPPAPTSTDSTDNGDEDEAHDAA